MTPWSVETACKCRFRFILADFKKFIELDFECKFVPKVCDS